jgi:hypothetical protein
MFLVLNGPSGRWTQDEQDNTVNVFVQTFRIQQ